MKNLSVLAKKISLSVLFAMFFVVLPLEILFQILWLNGVEGISFWIENFWKTAIVAAIITPLVMKGCFPKVVNT